MYFFINNLWSQETRQSSLLDLSRYRVIIICVDRGIEPKIMVRHYHYYYYQARGIYLPTKILSLSFICFTRVSSNIRVSLLHGVFLIWFLGVITPIQFLYLRLIFSVSTLLKTCFVCLNMTLHWSSYFSFKNRYDFITNLFIYLPFSLFGGYVFL